MVQSLRLRLPITLIAVVLILSQALILTRLRLKQGEAVALKMKQNGGFTLIELILVVFVVITIALIAFPTYRKSRAKALSKEAIANLRLLAAAERIYRMDNNGYATCANASACNPLLKTSLNAVNWQYDVSGSASAVTVRAVSGGCTYTLSNADFDAEPQQSGSCP